MSKDFSIIPDPTLVALQASIFLTNIYVCKKLFVEPFLALKDSRDSAISRGFSEAELMGKRAKETERVIKEKEESFRSEMKLKKQEIIASAKRQREKMVSEAKKSSEKILGELSKDLDSLYESERKNSRAYSEKIAKDMYSFVVN